jgi:hypothetical protein
LAISFRRHRDRDQRIPVNTVDRLNRGTRQIPVPLLSKMRSNILRRFEERPDIGWTECRWFLCTMTWSQTRPTNGTTWRGSNITIPQSTRARSSRENRSFTIAACTENGANAGLPNTSARVESVTSGLIPIRDKTDEGLGIAGSRTTNDSRHRFRESRRHPNEPLARRRAFSRRRRISPHTPIGVTKPRRTGQGEHGTKYGSNRSCRVPHRPTRCNPTPQRCGNAEDLSQIQTST